MPPEIEHDIYRVAGVNPPRRGLGALDLHRPHAVALTQSQVDALDLDVFVVRVDQRPDQGEQVERGARPGPRTVEGLLQRHVFVATQAQRAGHVQAALAAAVRSGFERLHRRNADERGEHPRQIGESEIEAAAVAVRRLDPDRHRDGPRLGADPSPQAREAVLVEGADHRAYVAEPHRAVQPRHDPDHFHRRHRHPQWAHTEVRVAHRQDFAVLDPGHGTADRQLEVAVDQDARDRAAGTQVRHPGGVGAAGRRGGEHSAHRIAEAQGGDLRTPTASPVRRRDERAKLLRDDLPNRRGDVVGGLEHLLHGPVERPQRARSRQPQGLPRRLAGFQRAQLPHRGDRRDQGESLTGERPGIGNRAGKAFVEVDGAAAHPGDDARLFQAVAAQTGNDVARARVHFPNHADDLDAEARRLATGEHGQAVAGLPAGKLVDADLVAVQIDRRSGFGARRRHRFLRPNRGGQQA